MLNLDVNPPQYVLDTLALGPRNSVLDKFNKNMVLAELDILLGRCERDNIEHDSINDINIAVVRYIRQCEKQHFPRNLKLTQAFLKKHDLLAIPFDKGTGFCVMKAAEYEAKIMDILNLPQFEKMIKTRKNAKDPTIKEHERIHDELVNLHLEGKLDGDLCRKLTPIGSQPPRLYGLAKVHKSGTPVRPVLSMPGSAYHNVANQIAEWLSVVPEAQINSSSKMIYDLVKTIKLEND